MSDSQTTPGSGHTVQISDIAERTGYSLATVSKVLNGRSDVAAGTRQIIEEALRDSGYTKRISTTKNRKLIEAVFQNFDNIWSLEMLRGIVHEASAHEMSVVTTESGDRSHPDSRWVEGVLRRQPLGVVLVFSNLTESEKSRLQAFNIDYVTLDPAGDPSPDNLPVQADNWTGGLIATRHLLAAVRRMTLRPVTPDGRLLDELRRHRRPERSRRGRHAAAGMDTVRPVRRRRHAAGSADPYDPRLEHERRT